MIEELKVGDKAPDFSLPGTEKQDISLSTFPNKKVVLYFYPKDDTSGCTLEAHDFQSNKDAFEACDTVILGVSPDSIESHCSFQDKNSLTFLLLADTEKKVLQAYGVWGEKSMYGRKYMGVERSTFLIDRNGIIQKIWRKVKVPGHAEDVLSAAKALP